MTPKSFDISEFYHNLDNDPRGPYTLTSALTTLPSTNRNYEWNGVTPPNGHYWKFNIEKARELENTNQVLFKKNKPPKIKRYLNDTRERLKQFTSKIADTKFKYELEFLQVALPQLTKILNYEEEETFYNFSKNHYTADVALAQSVESKPWVIFEIKRSNIKDDPRSIDQVRHYLVKFDCPTGVLLTPDTLTVISSTNTKSYNLKNINDIQIDEIIGILDRGAQPPALEFKEPPPIETLALTKLIESVETAKTNDEKGKTLESLAHALINKTPSLRTKHRNFLTRSSEIDLIVEHDKSKGHIPIFDELGRYCLVECKNWSIPAGVTPVRDFLAKLDKCKVKLGIIFSKNGVTGIDSGADALREIQSKYDRDGVFLIVFTLEDIKNINNGELFVDVLDRKADNLRFDAPGN